MLNGIDTSHYQGTAIDWRKVIASGRVFAFMKCTDGVSGVDTAFAQNRTAALGAGLRVGAYHFYRYQQDWGPQATSFVKNAAPFDSRLLPPVLDLEDEQGLLKIGADIGRRRALVWLQSVENASKRRPIIYTSKSFADTYLTDAAFSRYPLWLAAYAATDPRKAGAWKQNTFWQYSETGSVPGIKGPVDLDRFYGTIAQLSAL